MSFFAMGGMALVAAVLLRLTLSESDPRAMRSLSLRELLKSYEPLRRHCPTVAVLLATVVGEAGLWCSTTYLAAFLVQRHGFGIEDVGWVFLAISVLVLSGTVLAGGWVGADPRSLSLVSRAWAALSLGAALVLPLPWPVSVGLVLIAAPTFGMAGLATTLVLTAVSLAGRATTLSLSSAATGFGTALGGIVGGLMLALGDYPALGFCSLVLLLASMILVVWSQPREARRQGVTAL
jgi:predicted MFS family arabinose efflux permease